MILVLVTYTAGPDEIGRVRAAHIDWLKQGVTDGRLHAAGRQVPPAGGMLLARGELADIEAWCATDPFATEGVATHKCVEILMGVTAPGLEALGQ
jgi:uncharacterized protein YciI